jgi:predicted DNA-binding protein with PD1-like motif
MRLLATRLREGQDLKLAIEKFIRDESLSAATVISAVGSLSHVKMRMAGARPDKQDVRDYDGSFEIVSLIGNIGQSRTNLHMAISDSDGKVVGGHLKEGSVVHTTVELVLAVEDSLEFGEEIDKETGFGELSVKSLKKEA